MSQINHNYRIGVDTLPTGKVKATCRGRKTNVKTFPEGTTHEAAATAMAQKIEGDRFSHVGLRSGQEGWKSDWEVWVS